MTTAKSKKSSKKNVTKSTKSSKSSKSSTREAAKLDRFGSRLTSNVHKVNKVLNSSPLDVDDIQSKTKMKRVCVYNHLRTLLGKGLIRKLEDGYVVRKSKKAS